MHPEKLLCLPLMLLAFAAIASGCADGCGDGDQRPRDAATSTGPGGAPPVEDADPAPHTNGAEEPAPPPPEPPLPDEELYPATLEAQREALFRRMRARMRVTDAQMDEVRAIFEASSVLGQGNPAVTKYPMTRKECRERRAAAGVHDEDKPACGAPFMVPIYDPTAGETEADARVCIDRYEFPGFPCEHPVVFPTAREAAALCAAVGKRLCDAHEWEGACAGAVHAPDVEYAFGKSRKDSRRMHNKERQIVWAYGPTKDHARCATGSRKSKKCTAGGWKHCGSNTYPAGAFPGCVSPFGVYDLHGNAAEHMNLPTKPEELASAGPGATEAKHGDPLTAKIGVLGWTEMKGSWFIFSRYEAHKDDCRWRAPDWHATRVMDFKSHANYHLGFRCCASTTGAREASRGDASGP